MLYTKFVFYAFIPSSFILYLNVLVQIVLVLLKEIGHVVADHTCKVHNVETLEGILGFGPGPLQICVLDLKHLFKTKQKTNQEMKINQNPLKSL